MASTQAPEFWLNGPVENVPDLLQPVAHALLQAGREVREALADFPTKALWDRPKGIASVGFHLRHLAGVLDRLFTYARGEQLNERQLDYLKNEGTLDNAVTTEELLNSFSAQVDRSIKQLRETDPGTLTMMRGVGRKQIPSTVMGLLFHAAEHTMRHTGQLLVTVKMVQ